MPKRQKAKAPSRILLPPSNDGSGQPGPTPARKPRYAGTSGDRRGQCPAERQAARDAGSDRTAARPQHAKGSDRSTNRRDGQGAVFSFRIRERICKAHEECHEILRERVVRAKGQGTAASFEGLAAELRAVTVARTYQAEGHGPVRAARGTDVRRELLAVAASAILLAEAADRPPQELRRGEKSTAKQWFRPDFALPE